ncbi:hypothetical protein M427DRAFT_363472 [Gonapodya prolifera JEL478]|uniref:Uncharacterized protein n=1 Tax=Gonapodya prolifera (strain JEL478) TaxID=1344416 RepID=A0A139AAN4_GONPJ|nr:hypothetical protein M427DRAFT_363472 [Gonapodya prolifera JEL478]|eukprot:KXS13768.1 hypothetical protein M427DRAFT_363472 [Gonapodya prolifera JEL478]
MNMSQYQTSSTTSSEISRAYRRATDWSISELHKSVKRLHEILDASPEHTDDERRFQLQDAVDVLARTVSVLSRNAPKLLVHCPTSNVQALSPPLLQVPSQDPSNLPHVESGVQAPPRLVPDAPSPDPSGTRPGSPSSSKTTEHDHALHTLTEFLNTPGLQRIPTALDWCSVRRGVFRGWARYGDAPPPQSLPRILASASAPNLDTHYSVIVVTLANFVAKKADVAVLREARRRCAKAMWVDGERVGECVVAAVMAGVRVRCQVRLFAPHEGSKVTSHPGPAPSSPPPPLHPTPALPPSLPIPLRPSNNAS